MTSQELRYKFVADAVREARATVLLPRTHDQLTMYEGHIQTFYFHRHLRENANYRVLTNPGSSLIIGRLPIRTGHCQISGR